jgi:hypothetical protein
VGAETDERVSAEPDAARRRSLESADRLQERALARPVGTDDGDDLAVVDPEGDAVDCREAPEPLR